MIALPPKHNFVDAVEALLASSASGSLESTILEQRRSAQVVDWTALIHLTVGGPLPLGQIKIDWLLTDVMYRIPIAVRKHRRKYRPSIERKIEALVDLEGRHGIPQALKRERHEFIFGAAIMAIGQALRD